MDIVLPERVSAVILAAGAGTRMRSARPKPLHPVGGRPMIDYVTHAVESISPSQIIVVLSPELNSTDAVLAHLQHQFGNRLGIAIQPETLGTGHAIQCAAPLIADAERVLVLFADHPLLTQQSVESLATLPLTRDSPLGLLTCVVADAAGYGRIARDDGTIVRIVERKDDEAAERVGPTEVNSGMMVVEADWLRSAVGQLSLSAATGEYYLTQLVEIAVLQGLTVQNVFGVADELMGVNDRVDLAEAERVLQNRIRIEHQRNGVTFVNPESSVVESGVTIGPDSVILPGCLIRTGSVIGAACEIGPNSVLTNARIEDRCRVTSSFVSNASILAGSDVGPFSHIRSGSKVGPNVHVGNFSEIKNSSLNEGVRMGHFGYIGDATIGGRTNIGAGVVTCNYDGTAKHQTRVGSDVFLGSDSMLIAPITIGDNAVTGAGSVVTRDVDAGTLVAGVPAKPLPSHRNKHEESQ